MPYGSKQLVTGFPLDEPKLIRAGVMHKESDAPGSGKFSDSGLPLGHPERQQKGDIAEATRPAPRSSFEFNGDQVPFAFLTPRGK